MTEQQFRAAVQINTKCGKKVLDLYCMNHGPEYTDEEYNMIIENNLRLSYYRKSKRPIMSVSDLSGKLTYINPRKK